MNKNVELLHALVSTPSLSREESAVAELLVAHMNGNGFDAHVDEVGNAVGVRSGAPSSDGSPQRCVCLLGHIDTVPGVVPVRIEDGVLYGRGSVDAKGSIATFTRAVAQMTPAPGVDLVVVGCVEEEASSSRGARHARDMYKPEVCFIGEPSGWDALTIGYKGCARFHADFEAPVGHSAGPIAPVAELAADVWQALKSWCAEYNQDRTRLFDQVLVSLSKFVTESDGLHDRVTLRIGFRLPPDFDIAILESVAKELAPDTPMGFNGHEVAWQSAATTPLARALRRSILKAGGRGALKKKTGTSDMNVVGPAWKCPIVAYGPGDSTLDHTPNEHLPLDEYEQAIEVLCGALVEGGWALER